jgi:Predicted DNA-binding protein with PD1-like DNA-binding motif
MHVRELSPSREFFLRLETGQDWRGEIEAFAEVDNFDAAWFHAMGAVQDAELLFYDQDEKSYESIFFDEPLEMAACVGNIGFLDDERFAHTHAVLSRETGGTLAGHLNSATVFAGEAHLRAFETPLVRSFDETTELDLWL